MCNNKLTKHKRCVSQALLVTGLRSHNPTEWKSGSVCDWLTDQLTDRQIDSIGIQLNNLPAHCEASATRAMQILNWSGFIMMHQWSGFMHHPVKLVIDTREKRENAIGWNWEICDEVMNQIMVELNGSIYDLQTSPHCSLYILGSSMICFSWTWHCQCQKTTWIGLLKQTTSWHAELGESTCCCKG